MTTRHLIARRLATAATAVLLAVSLSACSGNTPSTSAAGGASTSGAGKGTFNSGHAEYDAIINAGPVAGADAIAGNKWASAVKAAGTLRLGGTQTSQLFSLLDPASNKVVGFDAGLGQLLSRYILGDVNTTFSLTTTPTREQMILSNQVDAVIATYSITAPRMEKINFAGPYYQSQAGILVKADNTTINSVNDLAGKKVATQQGSTGVTTLQAAAPQATIVELPDDAQCVAAVESGQVDAYVIDQTLLLSGLLTNKNVKIVGDPFGPVDAYGIGVSKDSDGKDFINQFLTAIENDGTWVQLWKATIQAKTGVTQVASPPAIGSAGN